MTPPCSIRSLASDFIHPVVTGDFLTKAQHIYYSSRHVPPANLKNRFDKLSVRMYGAVGIVSPRRIFYSMSGSEVLSPVIGAAY
jgi:hypothetical protein